ARVGGRSRSPRGKHSRDGRFVGRVAGQQPEQHRPGCVYDRAGGGGWSWGAHLQSYRSVQPRRAVPSCCAAGWRELCPASGEPWGERENVPRGACPDAPYRPCHPPAASSGRGALLLDYTQDKERRDGRTCAAVGDPVLALRRRLACIGRFRGQGHVETVQEGRGGVPSPTTAHGRGRQGVSHVSGVAAVCGAQKGAAGRRPLLPRPWPDNISVHPVWMF
ncbi:unnamed protein product, partial [Pylaiella littoralis]